MNETQRDEPLKIAVVGTAPSSLEYAPWGDESWKLWSLSGNFAQIPRWDRWFELHKWPQNPAAPRKTEIGFGWEQNPRAKYLTWLREQQKPIMMQEEYSHIPASSPYPLGRVLELFPHRYFTNSVSLMMAYAILQKPQVLGVWGVDMALDDEYMYQRPSVEYYLGIAKGMGIHIEVPGECDLLKCKTLYAFEEEGPWTKRVRAKVDELQKRKSQVENQKMQKMMSEAALQGAIEQLEWVDRTFDK